MRHTTRLAIALLLLVAAVVPSSAAAQTPSNLLHNGSFEGGMYHVSMSNFIAEGWQYWYESRAADDPRGWWLPEPEYGLMCCRPGQMRTGAQSQRWFTTWAIHNAGMLQTVKVPENAWLRFTIWMFNWSSQADVFGISDGFHRKWVGIDPTGGTNPYSPTIVWGEEDRTMDAWVQLGVVAKARGDRVTVFVRERPEYSVKHNDILIDDAELIVVPEPPQPVVQPVARMIRRAATNNDVPERAIAIGVNPIEASSSPGYQYFVVDYPGGGAVYHLNILANPAPDGFGFRVYGPSAGRIYTTSGFQRGMTPNVAADLIADEKGKYLIQIVNETRYRQQVDFRIWLSAAGLLQEARIGAE